MITKALVSVLLLSGLCSAQLVSVGAKGGIPFLDALNGSIFTPDESRPYAVGPSIEVRLPAHFAIEADALYRRVGQSANYTSFPGSVICAGSCPTLLDYHSRTRGNAWQFPVLGKYYLRPRVAGWQPFVGVGWALRTVGLHYSVNDSLIDVNGNPGKFVGSGDYRSQLTQGAVAAAGVRFRRGHRLAFTPQVRYTRWASSYNSLRQNEAGAFLGVSF